MAVDVIYETAEDTDAIYQLVPNPDADPGSGFKYGGVLRCKDRGGQDWHSDIFICPGAIADLGEMFTRAAMEV